MAPRSRKGGILAKFLACFKGTPEQKRLLTGNDSFYDSMSPAQQTDMFGLDLYYKDYDMWYAITMFRSYLALAVEEEFHSYRAIDPQYVLVHVEDRYTGIPSRVDLANGSAQQAGYKLCRRIKAARASRNRGDLNKLLEDLKKDIRKHCSDICKEQAAELGIPTPWKTLPSGNHGPVNRSLRPLSSDTETLYGNGTHLGATSPNKYSSSITEDRDMSSASSYVERPEELFSPGTESRNFSSFGAATSVEVSQIHVYTQMLHSHADSTGTKFQTIPAATMSPQGWPCTVRYGDIEETAVADNKKTAGHIAARLMCQRIGLIA